jgi:hypothetical protein
VPDPRTETIRFRCTPGEVEDFERAAAADQRTVSDWLRFVASRASTNVGPVAPPLEVPVRKELYEDATLRSDPRVVVRSSRQPRNPPPPPVAVAAPPKAPRSSGMSPGYLYRSDVTPNFKKSAKAE